MEAEPTWTFLRRSNGDVDNRLLPDGEAASILLGEPEASRGGDVRSTRSCLGDGITPFVASRVAPSVSYKKIASCWRFRRKHRVWRAATPETRGRLRAPAQQTGRSRSGRTVGYSVKSSVGWRAGRCTDE